jgi:glycosyltransferase involved in cell wall biosynthesis
MSAPRVLVNAISLAEGGGGRNYLLNLLRELGRDPRGFSFSVVVPRGQLPAAAAAGHEIIEVSLPARARMLYRGVFEQVLLPLRARRFDLLYCVADMLPLSAATPTVVALRNLNIYDRSYYDDARTRALFRFVRRGVHGASAVICPSAAAADIIAPILELPRDRFTVVPHGVSTEAFEAQIEPAEHEVPYLFLPARIERHKNFEVLFGALRKQSDPRLEIWIAGSDRLDPPFAELVYGLVEDMGLASRVRFLGDVPYAEILRYYKGAEALVFPSLLESFGHPLLEAMLSGTPIVASDLPASREVAGDAALFFPPRDAEALARAIERLRAEPEETQRRVARGRVRAGEFSWSRSIDGLCQVFEHVLSPSRVGSG